MAATMFQPSSSSPLTTKGDIWVFGTGDSRLPVGSDGQVLLADSTQSLGLRYGTVTASAAYQIGVNSSGFTATGNHFYEVSASATYLITFDVASGYSGQSMEFSRTDNNPGTIISLKVNGSTTVHMSTITENWKFVSDGANWRQANHYATTAWTSFNPTIGAVTTPPQTTGTGVILTGLYRRNGDNIQINYYVRIPSGATGNSAGSGAYLYPLPTGVTANSGLLTINTSTATNQAAGTQVGVGYYVNLAGSPDETVAFMYDTANMKLLVSSVAFISSTSNAFSASVNLEYGFNANIPILNWEP